MKSMAEVLTEHAFHLITPVNLDDVNGPWQVECNCTADPIQGISFLAAERAFAAHQSDALTAAGYRPMTLVELAARDRPESMEAARAQVRAERRAAQAESIRAAQEVAWAKGATSAGMNLMALQVAGINPNPYRKTD